MAFISIISFCGFCVPICIFRKIPENLCLCKNRHERKQRATAIIISDSRSRKASFALRMNKILAKSSFSNAKASKALIVH